MGIGHSVDRKTGTIRCPRCDKRLKYRQETGFTATVVGCKQVRIKKDPMFVQAHFDGRKHIIKVVRVID